MSLPPEFKDIDERIDSIFESGDAYRETTDISVPETLPPEMTDEQAEKWMEPIEDIGDDTQKYDAHVWYIVDGPQSCDFPLSRLG